MHNPGCQQFSTGGGAGDSTVWDGDVGTFRDNREEGGRDTHWVPSSDNKEASEAAKRRDVGDAWGGRRTGGSRNAVGKFLHRETAGNRSSVGFDTSII